MTNSLPPQDSNEPDDLISGEAELKALYDKLPRHEPSPALDAAVLRAAAEAVSASDSATAKPRNRAPRWLIGLSSAATLVLAAGLAWHMRSMPQTDSVSGSVTATNDEVTTKAGNAPAPITPGISRDNASAMMVAPAAAPPPPESPKQPPPKRMLEVARLRHVMKTMADRPSVQDVHGYAAHALEARSPAPALRESESVRQPAPPPVSATATDKAIKPPPRIQPQVAAPAPSPPMQEMASGNLSPADTPPQQLQEIRQLYAQGHDDRARKKLLAFRREHPQWSLPDDLNKRLQQP